MKYPLRTTDLLGIPKINDLNDMCFHTKLSIALLHRMTKAAKAFYIEVNIPKKSGGFRKLACPSKKVKVVQAWILKNILEKIKPNAAATAFIKGSKVIYNVTPHAENKYLLCLDLEDFFDNIIFYDVFFVFRSLGYTSEASALLSNICTYKGRLPQGGVTSPMLSNIICIKLDERLSRFAGARNIVYTRYADDMTFSAKSPDILLRAKKTIDEIIVSEGFNINAKKTRLLGPRQQLKVTGIVISNEKSVGIGRKQKRFLRAAFHHAITKPMLPKERSKRFMWMIGWFNYLHSVDKKSALELMRYVQKLLVVHSASNPKEIKYFQASLSQVSL